MRAQARRHLHMRKFISLLSTLAALTLANSAHADDCDEIRLLIPEHLSGFTEILCEDPNFPQIRAELTLEVPADEVVPLAAELTKDYGMFRLVDRCCGYEPAGIIAAGPDGTFQAFTVALYAEAFDGISRSPQPLGALPGRLLFRLMDIEELN